MRVGPILAADAFYTDRPDLYDTLADYGVLAVEMESAALYTIAARFRARALTLLTVSDHIKTGEHTTAQEREQTFAQMVEIALDAAIAPMRPGSASGLGNGPEPRRRGPRSGTGGWPGSAGYRPAIAPMTSVAADAAERGPGRHHRRPALGGRVHRR